MSTPPETSDRSDPGDRTGLDASAIALNRTVDGLSDDDLEGASLLPGWSRAHVVAHVALNGLALAEVLDGVGRGQPVAMYRSDEERDDDIADLVAAGPSELRDRLLAATTAFGESLDAMGAARWRGTYSRVPGGPVWPASGVVATRRRELEVHHADLGASYTREDWPAGFVVELLDTVTEDRADDGPFHVRASDLGREWVVGGDGGATGPLVLGSGADLGWWLTGRGQGEGLSCDAGLPALGPWRRAHLPAPRP